MLSILLTIQKKPPHNVLYFYLLVHSILENLEANSLMFMLEAQTVG